MIVKIKPLSINECWKTAKKTRLQKTELYTNYQTELLYKLPRLDLPEKPLKITLEFGFSNKASDIDNPVKPFLDTLQEKYKFNDKDIYYLIVAKKIVEKGNEYIDFKIENLL